MYRLEIRKMSSEHPITNDPKGVLGFGVCTLHLTFENKNVFLKLSAKHDLEHEKEIQH